MTDSPAEQPLPEASSEGNSPTADDGLEELRQLVVGPVREQIQALSESLEDPGRQARSVSRVLPEAIALRSRDAALSEAIAPSVEKSIGTLVRRNPKPIADALFPVMGPAIRKAIAHALASMVESLNRTLEHSLSFKALRWRIEGWRTGKSFSEVVLVHTLLYRVEQLFLIHRDSGLVIHHLTAPSVAALDADMVSGMLTAIRDFARDSFRVGEDESYEALKLTGLDVWIEQGPHAILAAVVRGHAPAEFRHVLESAVESVHLQFAEGLEKFDGDTRGLEPAGAIIEGCFEARYAESTGRSSLPGARLFFAAIAAGLLIAGFFWIRDRVRWNRYLERIRAEPGIVVVSTGKEGGQHVVTGLRDPLASDPASLIQGTGLAADDVRGRWELYQALNPTFVRRRAEKLLRPPASVKLGLDGRTLSVAGVAPDVWIADSRKVAILLPGVEAYQDRDLESADWLDLKAGVDSLSVRFVKGSTHPVPGQQATLEKIFEYARRLDERADPRGRQVLLHIFGHTDSEGSPDRNLPLSRARAEWMRDLLAARNYRHLQTATEGLGSSSPLTSGTGEEINQLNRRVSFRVEAVGTPR